MTRRTSSSGQRSTSCQNKIRDKVTKGKDKVTDAADRRLLQQEQGALRAARAARPAHRADQGQGQGRSRPRRRSSPGQSLDDGGQEVLDRPGLQGQGRQAAGVAKGQQEKALDKRLRGQEGQARRARSRPSSATTSSRSRRSRRPSSRRSTQAKADDQADPGLAEPAEGAERRSSRTSEAVEGQDGLPQGLRRRRLQERAEGEADDDRGAGDRRTQQRARRRPRRRPHGRRRRLGSGTHAEPAVADAVARLDELTRRLRRECPWDREQDERSIVPHTVEEAYELADAANARRRRQAARRARRRALPGPLPLAAARGARRRVDSPQVAEHVPPEADPPPPARLRRGRGRDGRRGAAQLGRRSSSTEAGREPGIFGEVPENLPGAAVRAQGPAPAPPARASTSSASPTTP